MTSSAWNFMVFITCYLSFVLKERWSCANLHFISWHIFWVERQIEVGVEPKLSVLLAFSHNEMLTWHVPFSWNALAVDCVSMKAWKRQCWNWKRISRNLQKRERKKWIRLKKGKKQKLPRVCWFVLNNVTDFGNLFHQPYIHLIQSSSGLYFKRVQTVLVASTAVLCVVTQRSSTLSCVTTQRKAA